MIKLEHVNTNKGFIVEEINDKLNKKLMDSGKVESGLENMATPDVESAEESSKKLRKVVDKKIKDAEKKALEVKGEDRVVDPNSFKESMKVRDRKELTSFLLKLREQKIRRRIIPLHENAEGYRFEIRYEKPLTEEDKPAPESIEDCQKWIDYDMKHYGKISDNTNNIVKKAGFQIIKDDHGDYEVTAGKYESCKKELKESHNEPIDIEALESYVRSLKEGDNITVTADLLNILEKSLEMARQYESLTEAKEIDKTQLKNAWRTILTSLQNAGLYDLLDAETLIVANVLNKYLNESLKEEKEVKIEEKPVEKKPVARHNLRKLTKSEEEEQHSVKESLDIMDFSDEDAKAAKLLEEVDPDFAIEMDFDDEVEIPQELNESVEKVKTDDKLKGTMWDFGDEE